MSLSRNWERNLSHKVSFCLQHCQPEQSLIHPRRRHRQMSSLKYQGKTMLPLDLFLRCLRCGTELFKIVIWISSVSSPTVSSFQVCEQMIESTGAYNTKFSVSCRLEWRVDEFHRPSCSTLFASGPDKISFVSFEEGFMINLFYYTYLRCLNIHQLIKNLIQYKLDWI